VGTDELVVRLPFWETVRGRLGLAAVLISPFALLLPNGESGMGGLIGLGVFAIGASAFRPTLVITPDLIVIGAELTDDRYVTGSWNNPYRGD
jgi:hypothetical protein